MQDTISDTPDSRYEVNAKLKGNFMRFLESDSDTQKEILRENRLLIRVLEGF